MKKSVTVINHPIISERLSLLRDINTDIQTFRSSLHIISLLMTYEITHDIELNKQTIKTPLSTTDGFQVKKEIVIIPVLRAGLGMIDGMLGILPNAKVGHIGIYRDQKTLKPVSYYCNLPKKIDTSKVLLVDPMLATGESSVEAVNQLKKLGARDINFICLISCQEGIDNFHKYHPKVKIYTTSIDPILTNKGYISPGLGDAGDRFFGTL